MSRFVLLLTLGFCIVTFADDHGQPQSSPSGHPQAGDQDLASWTREARERCAADLDKNWPRLYLYLMQGKLPRSMANSHFQVIVRDGEGNEQSFLVPDPRASRPMTLVPLLGRTKEIGGKQVAEYKIKKRVMSWRPPGNYNGAHIELPETGWLTTDKQGLCLDFGVRPIPLKVTTGTPPQGMTLIDVIIEYKLGSEPVRYHVDLMGSKNKTSENGVYQSELLAPSAGDLRFKYTLRYRGKDGFKTVSGEQTYDGKSEPAQLDVSSLR